MNTRLHSSQSNLINNAYRKGFEQEGYIETVTFRQNGAT
jgi:hypothetical protein